MSRNWIPGNRRGGFGRGVDNAQGMVGGRGMIGVRGTSMGRSSPRNTPNPHARYPLFGPIRPAFKQRRDRGNLHSSSISREQWNEDPRPSTALPGNRTFRNRSLVTSVVDFYRVTLQRCKSFEKVMLFTYISDKLDGASLLPFGPRVYGSNWEFFVNDYVIAQRISEMTGKIILPDGSKMVVTVKPAIPPFEMNELTTQAITLALTNQYNCITKEANLEKFQNDSVFVAREMICSLNLNSVMVNVTDILVTIAPGLVIMNLNGNSITSLEEAGNSLPRFRSLTVLRLAGNNIRSMKELSFISALKLEELDLRGNGLEASFKFRHDYIREVRSMFPALKVLDGEALPKPIDFDLKESDMGSLPGWQQTCVHESCFTLVSGFIELYFKYYDEPGRLNLLAAYHPDATMSLVNQGDTNEGFSFSLVSAYQPFNRNLMMAGMRDSQKSAPLLHQGPGDIVAVLKTLPPSQHLLETFTCDLVLYLDNCLLQIVITGLFKEFGSKANVSGKPVKSFTRCFVMVRQGLGFLIVNDSLVIRYPTHSQFMSVKNVEVKRNMPMAFPPLKLEPAVYTTGMDIDEVSYVFREQPDSSQESEIIQVPIEGQNQNQLHGVLLPPELQYQTKQEPAENLTQNQIPDPFPEASEVSTHTKRRKRLYDEISSSEVNTREQVNKEGTSREHLISLSPSSSCSSERHNVLVSHLVNVYSLTPEDAESLLVTYNWDLEAIILAVNNKQISVGKDT